MKFIKCLLPSPNKAFTINRTVAVLVAVILFQCLVVFALFHLCRMEQQKSEIYGRFMTNVVIVPKPATINAPILHAP